MNNKWKMLFIVLASVNVVSALIIIGLLVAPSSDEDIDKANEAIAGIPFTTNTNKDHLNTLINHYIQKQNKGPIEYKIALDEEVIFYGVLPVFTKSIEMKMTFEAKAQEDGSLLLKEKSLSIGNLQLPASYCLKLISQVYQFPEWVSIQPSKETVYLNLPKMEIKSGFKVKMEEFDLKNDRIAFTLFVPVE